MEKKQKEREGERKKNATQKEEEVVEDEEDEEEKKEEKAPKKGNKGKKGDGKGRRKRWIYDGYTTFDCKCSPPVAIETKGKGNDGAWRISYTLQRRS